MKHSVRSKVSSRNSLQKVKSVPMKIKMFIENKRLQTKTMFLTQSAS